MLSYPGLDQLLAGMQGTGFSERIVPMLVRTWLADYDQRAPGNDVVAVEAAGFSYLFDIANERLVAAWGISRGKFSHERDASRARGHPMGYGALYHRGHAIPHSLGGALDINLVPQRGSINVGAFQALEREAAANPGSLYFTYWVYGPHAGQRPTGCEQGLLCPGQSPKLTIHAN
jgi:hypothetical protein